MLELQKKQIHMSRSKNTVSAQVTFDEDFNIPDAKPDVGSVLLKQADAVMEELRQLSEKVIIKGRLDFEILYAVEGSGRMKNLSGALTFEENVSYPGLEPRDEESHRVLGGRPFQENVPDPKFQKNQIRPRAVHEDSNRCRFLRY